MVPHASLLQLMCLLLGQTKLILCLLSRIRRPCFRHEQEKIVFVRERIKPGGEALQLPLRSLVSGVNYHARDHSQ